LILFLKLKDRFNKLYSTYNIYSIHWFKLPMLSQNEAEHNINQQLLKLFY